MVLDRWTTNGKTSNTTHEHAVARLTTLPCQISIFKQTPLGQRKLKVTCVWSIGSTPWVEAKAGADYCVGCRVMCRQQARELFVSNGWTFVSTLNEIYLEASENSEQFDCNSWYLPSRIQLSISLLQSAFCEVSASWCSHGERTIM